MRRVLIDTDVILDVALAREPFFLASKAVLVLSEQNRISGMVSSNEIANLYYILRKRGGDEKACFFIRRLISFNSVVSIRHHHVLAALDSGFKDFEDGLQNFAATEDGCEYIVTRHVRDYHRSELRVVTPEIFLSFFATES